MLAARRRHASANSAFQHITDQAPATPNRQEWRRFDLRSALVTTALGTGVLAAAGLWPANGAMAGCVDYDPTGTPNTVVCDTAQTTINAATEAEIFLPNQDFRAYWFNDFFANTDDIEVTITTDGDIDGFGLAVESFAPGASITVDHQGAISVDAGNTPAFGSAVFNLTTDGGDITYTGNGSVIDNNGGNIGLMIDTGAGAGNIAIGSAGSPVTPTYQGSTALRTNSGTGDQNIFLDGGTLVVTGAAGNGMFASSSTGNINIDLTGNTQITTTVPSLNGVWGVRTQSFGGATTISSDADIGSAGFELNSGINSFSTDGPIDITQTGGTIMATSAGIIAAAFGATGDISITTDAGSQIQMTGGTGIIADQFSTAGGATVTVHGEITGSDTGVSARIFDALNSANVVVSASGDIQALTGSSISAITDGTGNATVNLLDGAYLEGGVLARSTTGNASIVAGDNVTVIGNSPGMASISAGGDATVVVGDNALVTGSSGIVVDQTSPGGLGDATVVVGADGEIIGDGTDAADDYNGNGIFAGNQGIGETSVTTGAGTSVTGAANGIVAFQTNPQSVSTITVVTGGPVTGNGDVPFSLTPYTDAFDAEGLPTTGLGIGVSNVGSGGIVVTAGGTVHGDTTGIQTFVVRGGDTAIQTEAAVTGGVNGIHAIATTSGEIAILANGPVTGTARDGILTSAEDGNTAIQANGAVTGGVDGIDATATGAGNIAIAVADGAEVTGLTGSGITTDTAAGTARIENAGLIQGAFAAISGATSTVLDVVNQAGGLIQNLSADIGDLAISVTGTGATDIENDGTIRGRISLDAGDDTFTNSGTWATTGLSDFGAGNNTIVNSGLLVAAEDPLVAENTHLANISSFTNTSTGVITLVDDNAQNVHDTLTIDGTYIGEPGSTVMLDLALVAGDPQAGSDVLILDPANPATGTSDLLFNIVSTGVTATTADTGRVGFAGGQFLDTPVTVVENRGTLVTSSGDDDIPLARSGFINYDLVSTAPAGGDYQVVSSLDSGLAGGVLLPIHATLAAVAFTTQRTPNPITATCIDPDNKPNAQGGWARVFGADFQTETAGTAKTNGTVGKLESENRTRFATLQGGFDHVLCNLDGNGGNLHVGVTVGHTFGSSRQTDPDPLAGIFGTDVEFDTYFVGPYAAYTRGDLAIQASMRFDHHSLELANPTVGLDADGIDFDASAVSGTAAVSYDFDVREALTVTPEIGINVSKTKIDKFDIAGGTVILDDLWSAIGHVGVTARTTIPVIDNVFVIPFASATLYHEFIESADAQLIIGPTTTDVESNRVGTFGQLGVGANAVRLGDVVAGRPTLFGGARFDLQVGERIQGATATVFGRIQF